MLSYGMNIETAASGFEALEKIKSGAAYDIIFMDYMMPKMDGLETSRRIRDMGYTRPIVALTANAIMGQESLFIEAGCDDHMYKPIDVRELNVLLNRLIRDKQPPEVIKAARQEMKARNPGSEFSPVQKAQIYNELVLAVTRDAENAIAVLEDTLLRMNTHNDADLELFTATVHGMKSSFANMEEVKLSNDAHALEKAGAKKDLTVILAKTPAFIEALKSFIEESRHEKTGNAAEVSHDDKVFLREKLYEIIKACEAFNVKTAKTAVADLKKKTWPIAIKDIIDEISLDLTRGDFEKVMSFAEKQRGGLLPE
jgi:CheY-like chemotaxis protein